LAPVAAKWAAFGWDVREIDGHNIEEIIHALRAVQTVGDRPQMIIAHTLKGKGLSPFESAPTRKHGEPLTAEEAKIAFAELEKQ
ncbi:MAG: transketolase, partial [Chloroflexota bacterium]|nr:transketolase [Chloroflexota bacterium]